MNHVEIMMLDKKTRIVLWQCLVEVIEEYITNVNQARVAPYLDADKIRSLLNSITFTKSIDPLQALNFVVKGLWDYQMHVANPQYFGLFNPSPTTMGIAADALVAAFNPQLATWSHSPFAVEVEQHLIRFFASQFGYNSEKIDGTFTSGGTEANHTALLTALTHKFPKFAQRGLRGLDTLPKLYVSTESHHSLIRTARSCGLGVEAVQQIPVDDSLQMKVDVLIEQIAKDRDVGFAPFLVAATAGTTNAGVVDHIKRIADVAEKEKLWFHVDAAWGGAIVFVTEMRNVLEGIERSDSITFDTHKWLNVPMGAGLFLTRHPEILLRTFSIEADYMPKDALGLNVVDPYIRSLQCSRRFIGLKVFLSLAVAGWNGYSTVIRHQVKMGDLLRQELKKSGWKIVNQTKLPVVCFVDQQRPEGKSVEFVESIAQGVVSSGKAWISTTRLKQNIPVLRACITNYRTEPEDIHALVHVLNETRQAFYSKIRQT
ncbi:aminotransferase class V-fold PLP-dependent enzyme [Candidatus Borrarchaeum sp.]|uniref:pyridoxal phosphate-dependent decarboxylase family protein n=1 Tax=Candidatus Borrarchaeum sp. TaxID=2846742 RepID=UPI00257F6660|nr:aminotransferase class V-fold PLP-dependent enzyme [Candidatus Borrarchaeum sp.]